ncbi:MAG: TIGR03943 family protein [Anaerolineae bacterium]|nr:TIGR03943 family protein [Anaerolineae bacterium]
MSIKLENLLKAAVLAASGLMFYAKISSGTLAFYISQRFAWLSLVAVLLFVVLALTMAYRLVEGKRQKAEGGISIEQLPIANSQSTSHARTTPLGLAILAIPALLGLLVPARPLSASAIESRGIGLSAPVRPGVTIQAVRPQNGPKSILDWLRDFSRTEDLAKFNGQQADVIGFVYRDPRSNENEFWVSRFAVSCCVADATALGLLVQTSEANTLKTDSWVRVTGKLQLGEFAGEKMPMLVAEKIEPAQQPNQPYLYP